MNFCQLGIKREEAVKREMRENRFGKLSIDATSLSISSKQPQQFIRSG